MKCLWKLAITRDTYNLTESNISRYGRDRFGVNCGSVCKVIDTVYRGVARILKKKRRGGGYNHDYIAIITLKALQWMNLKFCRHYSCVMGNLLLFFLIP